MVDDTWVQINPWEMELLVDQATMRKFGSISHFAPMLPKDGRYQTSLHSAQHEDCERERREKKEEEKGDGQCSWVGIYMV